jgi:hypothetical protein
MYWTLQNLKDSENKHSGSIFSAATVLSRIIRLPLRSENLDLQRLRVCTLDSLEATSPMPIALNQLPMQCCTTYP